MFPSHHISQGTLACSVMTFHLICCFLASTSLSTTKYLVTCLAFQSPPKVLPPPTHRTRQSMPFLSPHRHYLTQTVAPTCLPWIVGDLTKSQSILTVVTENPTLRARAGGLPHSHSLSWHQGLKLQSVLPLSCAF